MLNQLVPAGHSKKESQELEADALGQVAIIRQSPSPLLPPISVLSKGPPFSQKFAANGELSTTQLSQESAHSYPPDSISSNWWRVTLR